MEIAYEINASVITDLQVQEWLVKAVLYKQRVRLPSLYKDTMLGSLVATV